MISPVYGEGAVADWGSQKWFAKFHAKDFLLDNSPWSSRPAKDDSDQIRH